MAKVYLMRDASISENPQLHHQQTKTITETIKRIKPAYVILELTELQIDDIRYSDVVKDWPFREEVYTTKVKVGDKFFEMGYDVFKKDQPKVKVFREIINTANKVNAKIMSMEEPYAKQPVINSNFRRSVKEEHNNLISQNQKNLEHYLYKILTPLHKNASEL